MLCIKLHPLTSKMHPLKSKMHPRDVIIKLNKR